MADELPLPRFQALADGGLLATFGDHISIELSRRIGRLVERLDARALTGLIDLVPSYTTLTVMLDPRSADFDAIEQTIGDLWQAVADDPGPGTGPAHEIVVPVLYGGEFGPDLTDVAAHAGLPADEVVRRHANAGYVIGALGFAPGFSFLIGLPPELAMPRRATPRTVVPAGSVGIGGGQTGVYTLPTPGGWSLIGRTPRRLFRPEQREPFLIRAGDAVRFQPIDKATFDQIADEESEIRRAAEMTARSVDHTEPTLDVVSPGLQTTVQDLGRPGQGRFGVSPGGAADRGALVAANRLVGNEDGAAALEITLLGPHLRALRPSVIALTGADLGARLNDQPFPVGQARRLRPGDEIRFSPVAGGSGARVYLAVAGGIDVPLVMGSRATDLTAGIGGWQGRALAAGDRIPAGTPPAPRVSPKSDRNVRTDVGRADDPCMIRVVRGPQADRFDASAWNAFLSKPFTVSSQSNRLGLRLDGPPITTTGNADLISEGIVTGAIQITSAGQPIVMLPARATIGGYAKIATVIDADLDLLGQARPGDRLRFREIPLDTARSIARRGEAKPAATWRALLPLIQDVAGSDLASFELTLPAQRIFLRLRRG